MNLRVFPLTLLLLTATVSYAADDKPADKPVADKSAEGITHRITGLSCKERIPDLREAVQEQADVKIVSIDFDRAEALFAYDPKLVSPERLRNLLGNRAFGIKLPLTIPRDKLESVEIPVVGLDCKGCSLGVYNVVMRVDGVEQVTASFKEGRVVALLDPIKTNRTALETALKKANVTVKAP